MKIDPFINRVFALLFGYIPGDGSERFHFFSQNLNEDRHGRVKGWPYHGRCWLRSQWFGAKFCWNLWTHFCGVSFSYDWEDGFSWHISFPPFAFWFSLSGFRKFRDWWCSRSWLKAWNEKFGGYPDSHKYTHFVFFSISIFNWALHWDFFKFDWGWSHLMPKWMDGYLDIPNLLLGHQKCSKEILKVVDTEIPMPEGTYPANVKMTRMTWKRPRWFSKSGYYAEVNIPKGIPHEGKGENSWDCGEDRLFGQHVRADNVSDAIASVVKSVLREREKYGKSKYPPPSQQVAAT